MTLPPPIPAEAQFDDYPDAYDLAGIPREVGKKYFINTRVIVPENGCSFCKVPCGNDYCPYTKESK
jgi:hypothetical protein